MPDIMPIERVPDWEKRLARQDAFWHCEIIDRPVVCMSLPKSRPESPPLKAKTYRNPRERWMDTEYVVESAVAHALDTDFLGDDLPRAWPNLGPEVFSAFFGMEMVYTAETSWGVPNLHDWTRADELRLNQESLYWKKLVEMTDALLEAGKGLFYVGLTDFHPGGDALAAFRDPMTLNLDMLEHPREVKSLLRHVTAEFFRAYDSFYEKLRRAGQAITSWPGIVSTKKWYVPSNDFSCMVSKEMFDDFFLPGIVEECRSLEASIYHLDGPRALRHLDSLLQIEELNAIQWVFGAGNGRTKDWIHIYRRCQEAGKGIQVFPDASELDVLIENLRPEGVWMHVNGVQSAEHAAAILRQCERWVKEGATKESSWSSH